MNPLIHHHQESVREFELKNLATICKDEPSDFTEGAYRMALYEKEKAVGKFLLSRSIIFWESEIQRMEGMRKTKLCPNHSKIGHDCDYCHDDSRFDAAIDAMLKPYVEAVEWGKNQMV